MSIPRSFNGQVMENNSVLKIFKNSKKKFYPNISGIEISTVSLGNSICMDSINLGNNLWRISSVIHFSRKTNRKLLPYIDKCFVMLSEKLSLMRMKPQKKYLKFNWNISRKKSIYMISQQLRKRNLNYLAQPLYPSNHQYAYKNNCNPL